MQRFDQPSILLQGPCEGTFARIGVELLHEEGRGDPAQPDRAGDAQHLLPPVKNPGASDAPTDIRLEARIALHVERPGGVQALTPHITQAWREPETHSIKEGEDNLGDYMDSQDAHSGQGRARPIAPHGPRRHTLSSARLPVTASSPASVRGEPPSYRSLRWVFDSHLVPLGLILRPFQSIAVQKDNSSTHHVWP